jgi:hypothetical protein
MGRYAVSGNEAQILCKASPMDRKRVRIVKRATFHNDNISHSSAHPWSLFSSTASSDPFPNRHPVASPRIHYT